MSALANDAAPASNGHAAYEKPGQHHGNGDNNTLYTNSTLNRAVTPGGHPVDTTQPAFPTYHRRLGNPAPLGLFSFASTTFILSMYNVSVRGITTPNVIVGMALGVGGLAQLLAGMWEFAAGNTFGATAFTSYGGFWISFALIYWPGSGILTAFAAAPTQLAPALGIYLTSWFIFTFIMLLATLRSSLALMSVFFFLTITFILLAAGEFTGSAATHTAGGAFGIITAFCAWYTGCTGLYTADASYFSLPAGDLSRKKNE